MIVKNFIIKNVLFTLLLILPVSAGINFVQQNNKLEPVRLVRGGDVSQGTDSGKLKYCSGGLERYQRCREIGHRQSWEQLCPGGGSNRGQSADPVDYYANKIAGGSNTVTVTFNHKAAYPDVRALEYSGLDPTAPLDVTAAAAAIHKMEIAVRPRPLR